jgi:L-2-hydroxyglutarate oxidase LhgO
VLRLLYDQAVHHGAKVSYGHKVVAYESCSTQNKPVVILEGGKRMDADLIINAAGIASLANISSGFESMNDWRPNGLSLYTLVLNFTTY